MDIKELQEIISILKQNDVTEFELEHNGTHLRLSRGTMRQLMVESQAQVDLQPAISQTLNGHAHQAATPAKPIEFPSNFQKVESPIVGTFYRKPSPEADVFVKEGDSVKKGDTLCIIEAMKLMNEIEAPMSGKIERIFVGDGQVVEYGETLFLINPSA